MRLSKHIKAISPLIATIILIAITIAGGLIVYALFTSTAGVASSKGQVAIESQDLVKAGDAVIFTITVKSSGSKPATNVTITLDGEAPKKLAPITLQPGQSISYTEDTLVGPYVIGNSYLVTIEATYSDGSTSSLVASVICRS